MTARLLAALVFTASISAGQPSSQSVTTVPCGGIDDTAAIAQALDTPRIPARAGIAVLLQGECRSGPIDLTLRQGVLLAGEGPLATRLRPLPGTSVMLDLTGSSHVTVRDLWLHADEAPGPAVGILTGQTTQGYTSDVVHLDGVRVEGPFGIAAFANLGAASSTITRSAFYTDGPGSIAMIHSGTNFFGIASPFQALDVRWIPSDWTMTAVELHHFGNGWAGWLGGARALRWYGGNMSTGHPGGVLSVNAADIGGTVVYPAHLILDGTTLYGDEITGALPSCGIAGLTSAVSVRGNEAPFPIVCP